MRTVDLETIRHPGQKPEEWLKGIFDALNEASRDRPEVTVPNAFTITNLTENTELDVDTVTSAPVTVTATSGSLPTPDGTVTIADATTPTVVELLEYCTELKAQLDAALADGAELRQIVGTLIVYFQKQGPDRSA